MSPVIDPEIARLRAAADAAPEDSGARWLLRCAGQTLEKHRDARSGGARPALWDQWEDWDDDDRDLTALTAAQRASIGEIAARLGSLAEDSRDVIAASAYADAARGLYFYLMPDDDQDDADDSGDGGGDDDDDDDDDDAP